MPREPARKLPSPSNLALLEQYGRPGTIGLVGADTPVDQAIRLAQKGLVPGKKRSLWSHAFVVEGRRADGRLWVIESDLDASRGFVRLGVQENRIDKYEDVETYPNLAVLDLGLTDEQATAVLTAALDAVAKGTRYAIGGIVKTSAALAVKQLWKQKQKDSTFCSSFVRQVYYAAGIDLVPGVAVRHTTPEHLAQTELPHTRYDVVRQRR